MKEVIAGVVGKMLRDSGPWKSQVTITQTGPSARAGFPAGPTHQNEISAAGAASFSF